MGLIVRTVIKETSTHKTIYTIENTDTQELYDVDREYIMSNINNIGVNKEGCPACAGKVSCNAPIPEEDILEDYDF